MRLWRGRVGALVAVCIGSAFIAGAPAAYAKVKCAAISGAGSSLQGVAQKEVWIEGSGAFGTTGNLWKKSECEADPAITYFPTSSGKGLNQWGATNLSLNAETGVSPFPAYIGTDVGPEGPSSTAGTQMSNMDVAGKSSGGADNGVVTVPVAQSAIAVLVSLPESCSATEKTTPKIESKKLEEEWLKDSITLETLVSGAGVVCTQTPQLYARESPSGTTAGFKRWNDDINPGNTEWDKLTLTAVNAESTSWPGTLPGGQPLETGFSKGSQLAEGVFEKPGTSGAIGYADLADAVKAGFTSLVEKHGHAYASFMVEVQRNASNETGAKAKYAPAEAAGGASNCENASYTATTPAEVGPNVDWSVAKQSNVESTTTYPICTLTFDVAWEMYSFPEKGGTKQYSEEQYNSVFNFFKYLVTPGAEGGGQCEELKKHHYGTLSEPVLKEALAGVKSANILF